MADAKESERTGQEEEVEEEEEESRDGADG